LKHVKKNFTTTTSELHITAMHDNTKEHNIEIRGHNTTHNIEARDI